MKEINAKCFLASNSAEGFVSQFRDCYNPLGGWNAYIIKGGPGTGKSTFMRRIIKQAEEKKIEAVEIYCASDPNSLDGVIFPQLKTVVMDGTAPHIVEPLMPGVSDCILDFSKFWSAESLKTKSEQIISATKENKAFHSSAAKYIYAAGKLTELILETTYSIEEAEKAAAVGVNTVKEFIPPKNCTGRVWEAFICGVTPKGVISFADSIPATYRFAVKDAFGNLSTSILNAVKNTAVGSGYEVIVFKNPILPSKLTDGIFIPELSLFIVREYEFTKLYEAYQQIPIAETAQGFEKETQLINELIILASEKIKAAKKVHDRLEEYYISAMDFNELNTYCESFCKKLFK